MARNVDIRGLVLPDMDGPPPIDGPCEFYRVWVWVDSSLHNWGYTFINICLIQLWH